MSKPDSLPCKPESLIQAELLQAINQLPGVRIFRNQVGTATTRSGQFIRFGLAVGSADLIGIRAIVITPDMVGQVVGQFLSVEVKAAKGKSSKAQENWRLRISELGGKALELRSAEGVKEIISL